MQCKVVIDNMTARLSKHWSVENMDGVIMHGRT